MHNVNIVERLISSTESRSLKKWKSVEQNDDQPLPPVLFFAGDPPVRLLESGRYVGYEDFRDVMQDVRTTDEPLANLYHTLILYFAAPDRGLWSQAVDHLRYNPSNQASWNKQAWTYKYYLSTDVLSEFSDNVVDDEHKIPGVGIKGRKIMREVLGKDEDSFWADLGTVAVAEID